MVIFQSFSSRLSRPCSGSHFVQQRSGSNVCGRNHRRCSQRSCTGTASQPARILIRRWPNQCDQNFATFVKIKKSWAILGRIIWYLGEILNLFWQTSCVIGHILIVSNDQILKNHFVIWSHWYGRLGWFKLAILASSTSYFLTLPFRSFSFLALGSL